MRLCCPFDRVATLRGAFAIRDLFLNSLLRNAFVGEARCQPEALRNSLEPIRVKSVVNPLDSLLDGVEGAIGVLGRFIEELQFGNRICHGGGVTRFLLCRLRGLGLPWRRRSPLGTAWHRCRVDALSRC